MKRDFKGIFVYLKKYMGIKKSIKGKVTSKVVAEEFKVKEGRLAVWINRNSIPYEVVLDFCLKEDINPLNVFYDRKVKA